MCKSCMLLFNHLTQGTDPNVGLTQLIPFYLLHLHFIPSSTPQGMTETPEPRISKAFCASVRKLRNQFA